MPRSIVGHTSNDFNEISVSSHSAEQFQASVSVEQPLSEVSVEQLGLSASVEQDRSSFDDLTEIQRPPRSGGNSPTSIDIGEGQHYRDRSQSSETSSRGRSRHRKRSKREYRHHSRDRKSRHHSSERRHSHRSSRSDGHSRSRRHDSREESGRRRHSDDRDERSGGRYRSSDRNVGNNDDRSRRDKDPNDGQPLFVGYDSTPIQGMTSSLPNPQLEANSTVQIALVPALEPTTQTVRVEEPTLDSGNTTQIDNNGPVFSSQPHNTIRYERADSQIKISQKSTRVHVLQVIANLNSVYHSYHHGEVIHPDFVQKFVDNLQLHHMGDITLRASCIDWKEWKRDFFISQLHALYPQNPDAIDMTFLQAVKDWRLLYDCMDETIVNKSFDSLLEIHHRYTIKEEGDEVKAVKLLHDKLHTPEKTNWTIRFLKAQSECSVSLPLCTIVDFRFVLMITFRNLYRDIKEFQLSLHLNVTGSANSKVIDSKKTQKVEPPQNRATDNKPTCTACGRFFHVRDKCPDLESKYANKTNSLYVGSAAHSLLVKETGPRSFIPITKRKIPEVLPESKETPYKKQSGGKKNWKDNKSELIYSLSPSSPKIDSNLLSVTLSSLTKLTSVRARVEALLDTGSLAGDFISEKTVNKFNFTPIQTNSKLQVCSGLDNTCYNVDTKIDLCVTFYNELLNNDDTFDISAIILKETPIDIIIGRDTIRRYQLFDKIPSQLRGNDLILEDITVRKGSIQCECQPKGGSKQPSLIAPTEILTVSPPHRILSSLISMSQNILGGSLPDDDEIDHDKTDTFKPWLRQPDNSDVLSQIKISGDKDLQQKIRKVCLKYRDIFSNELPAAPAKIPAFNLVVDKEKWEVEQNRAPPRSQSALKQTALFSTIETLLRQGIITKSSSPYYSQVLLVPKPDKTFRMCVDYRALNDCTPDANWPIPNITEMLRRIGQHKPKLFGIMDLTQGYHQAPLEHNTKAFTAFITFSGVYEFTRLPFGPKRAPSYFQQIMATIVLVGLIYMLCEMYVDDCIVFGDTNDEFVSRLDSVLGRFKKITYS